MLRPVCGRAVNRARQNNARTMKAPTQPTTHAHAVNSVFNTKACCRRRQLRGAERVRANGRERTHHCKTLGWVWGSVSRGFVTQSLDVCVCVCVVWGGRVAAEACAPRADSEREKRERGKRMRNDESETKKKTPITPFVRLLSAGKLQAQGACAAPHVATAMRAVACIAALVVAAAATRPPAPPPLPLIIHTWPWRVATEAGWDVLSNGDSPLDAVQAAAAAAEAARCDGTVGPGGSPDETGETTLDAMLMDGTTMRAGGVGDLRGVAGAVAVARLVMDTTTHTLLVGESAAAFAVGLGAEPSNLTSPASAAAWRAWQEGGCQPNFWRSGSVAPDPRASCGPYRLTGDDAAVFTTLSLPPPHPSRHSHDTIAAVAVDAGGAIAAGASSNGASHKIAVRVGDAAVPGGGAYASHAAGCGSTGDGDAHLRYLPCAVAVAAVEAGAHPSDAARAAITRIARREPGYRGALVVADSRGRVGAAAAGWAFSYSVASPATGGVPRFVSVDPIDGGDGGDGGSVV